MGLILYNAADLLWATRIKSTAEAVGVQARPARTPEMLKDRLRDSDVTSILLDLDAPEPAWALIGVLRGPEAGDRERRVRILCWGPHVATDLFARARELGADEVLTRGALHANLPDLLQKLGADGAAAG